MMLASVATTLAINYNYRILMVNTKHNDKALEYAFETKNNINSFFTKGKTDLEVGLSGVAKAIMSNKTSPEIITNYTRTIFRGRLEILTERDISKEEYLKQRLTFKEIVKMANRYYEIVFVDLKGIENDSVEREILEMSNIIVVNLNQNMKSFNKYLELRRNGMFLNKKNLIVLLGKADLDSKYNAKNLSREIREKDVFSIPYTTGFFEAANEGHVAEYFMKFRAKTYADINTKFMESSKEISERILSKIKELQMGIQ